MLCLIMCEYYDYCEHDTVLVHNKNCIRKSAIIKAIDTLVLKKCSCVFMCLSRVSSVLGLGQHTKQHNLVIFSTDT